MIGQITEKYENPNVEVTRYGLNSETCPPFASVRLLDANIQLLLLVSSHYSGHVPENLCHILMDKIEDGALEDEIISHLRQDVGFISMEYLSLISNNFVCEENLALAVNHHHLIQYGKELNQNPNGFALLKTLFNKNVKIVLHGHLHMFGDEEGVRSIFPQTPFSLPCSTLSSHTTRESNGFMVHIYEREHSNCWESFIWEISTGGYFTEDLFRPAYVSYIEGDNSTFKKIKLKK